MLDQNTDRMWYVIGAIIVGGLILTSSIMLFTDVAFAGVQDAFTLLSLSDKLDADEFTDEEWFDGATMVYDTNDFSFLGPWRKSVLVFETDQSVPEWGLDDATRIQSSGGTNHNKMVKRFLLAEDAVEGRDYLYSLKVKNNGKYPIIVSANTASNRTPANITIESGEARHIKMSVRKSNANIQLQLKSLREHIDEDMDVYLHGFKFGYRD